jgi:hypothetical protein
MAVRRPLVLGNQGQLELLQPDDTLAGTASGPQGPQGDLGPQGPQGNQGPTYGNIDGGTWNTTYGGLTTVDGGTF